MVNVMKGVIVECDPAMKQYLLYLDEKNLLGSKFILQDLDETHLFITSDVIEQIQNKLDELMDNNSFALGNNQQ